MIFVAIEGVETSGKSELINSIKSGQFLSGFNLSFKEEFLTSSNANQTINNALKNSIFLSEGLPYDFPSSFLYALFLESRNILAINRDQDFIIADRYIDTIMLYQGAYALENKNISNYLKIRTQVIELFRLFNIPIPDISIYLKIDEIILKQRFLSREGRSLKENEIAVIRHFMDIYEHFSKYLPNYYEIDARRSVQEVYSDVASIIINSIHK